MQFKTFAASSVVATAFALLAAGPASATVIEKFREVNAPYEFVMTDCEEATYLIEGVFNGRFILRQGTGPADQAFPYVDRFSFDETWTNLETGGWFTVRANMLGSEVKARPVDGTTFEFRKVEAGHQTVWSSEGELVARNSGALMITFHFDTLGDGMPGGVYDWDSFVVDERGPHEIADLCAIADQLT